MTVETTSIDSDPQAVLQQVATAYRNHHRDRPQPKLVVDALLQAEKAAKQQRLSYSFDQLIGLWQLCFSTGTRKLKQRGGIALGKGFYLPQLTPAFIGFRASDSPANPLEITNQIQVSGLKLKLTGPARYLDKKNLLAFDFTQMQISALGRPLYTGNFRSGKAKTEAFADQPISKLPFFAFFLVTDELIAARGRGGGLAIWVRSSTSA